MVEEINCLKRSFIEFKHWPLILTVHKSTLPLNNEWDSKDFNITLHFYNSLRLKFVKILCKWLSYDIYSYLLLFISRKVPFGFLHWSYSKVPVVYYNRSLIQFLAHSFRWKYYFLNQFRINDENAHYNKPLALQSLSLTERLSFKQRSLKKKYSPFSNTDY